MSFDKLLASLADLWAKHAPTVVMHVVLFIALRTWVVGFDHSLGTEQGWLDLKTSVDALLAEVGIDNGRGYALLALGYVYLSAFQWLANVVTQLPVLRPPYSEPSLNVDFLRYAGGVLRLRPDAYRVREKLDEVVEKFARGFKERGESEPGSWLRFDTAKWSRYYGLGIVATAGSLLWWLQGSSGAVSAGRVAQLVLALLVFTLLARWQVVRKHRSRAQQMRYAALRAYERDHAAEAEVSELRSLRAEALANNDAYWKAYDRNPVSIIRRYSQRWPPFLKERLWRRLPYLPGLADDWDLVRSQAARQEDYTNPPPSSLSVAAYQSRFRNLLECRGSGLCMLVDPALGLAPSAWGSGAEYSLDARCHGAGQVGIRYYAGWGADDEGSFGVGNSADTWGFLADIGPHPIELVAQGTFPPVQDRTLAWSHLTDNKLDTSGLLGEHLNKRDAKVAGIEVCSMQPARPGHTYLMRKRCRSGAEPVVAFQCFATPDKGRLLVAWRILGVVRENHVAPKIPPWWRPSAWGFLKALAAGRPDRATGP